MTPRVLLDVCAALLREVLKFDAPADGIVSAHFRKHRGLGARERHTLAETTYAVLRRRLLFQHLAQGGSGPLERRFAILGWAGDAAFLKAALSPDEQAWLARAQAVDRQALVPERVPPEPDDRRVQRRGTHDRQGPLVHERRHPHDADESDDQARSREGSDQGEAGSPCPERGGEQGTA